jgi:hypothetical protein
VLKQLTYVFIALLLMVIACEAMTFAFSVAAEHKANAIAELVASLKPGYTTIDNARRLFRTHGFNASTLSNACTTPRGPCDELSLVATNYQSIVIRRDPPVGFELFLFPPFKRAGFTLDLFFINGMLDSINGVYRVGTTEVKYSRGAGDQNSRSSEWKYENGGMAVSIGVGSSGAAFDVPFPRFAFNYMYSMRCVDARMLWPTAPPPTIELHGLHGCR